MENKKLPMEKTHVEETPGEIIPFNKASFDDFVKIINENFNALSERLFFLEETFVFKSRGDYIG